MNVFKRLYEWHHQVFMVWQREFRLVFTDPGVLIFFFALPTLYPIVYTLIYNPETLKEMPVVVIDNCSTSRSREFVRTVNQTEAIDIIGHAANMTEAKEALASHKCYGIIEIPSDFDRKIGNGEQAVVPFWCDMGLLLRYRQSLFALTDVQLAYGAKLTAEKLENAGELGSMVTSNEAIIETEGIILGDPTQGFASFVMPGILVLILQQSMLLGIVMLAGGSSERRRKNGGVDPLYLDADPVAMVIGKSLCYLVCYIPMVIFALKIVPDIFSLPHYGSIFEGMMLMIPMLLATSMMGQVIGVFSKERESAFIIIVFSSVVLLFLCGLTWPRYAMNGFWRLVGDAFPATWGVEGFVRINSNGGTLGEQSQAWYMMWLLSGIYFVLAVGLWWARRHLQRKAISERGVTRG